MYRGSNSPTPSLLSAYAADGTSSPSADVTRGGSSDDPERLLQRLSRRAAGQAVALVAAAEIVVRQELVGHAESRRCPRTTWCDPRRGSIHPAAYGSSARRSRWCSACARAWCGARCPRARGGAGRDDRPRANEVRLLLGVIAYNLGNLLRRLVLPVVIQSWSLTSLQQRLFKTGGRLIQHARYFVLQLAESYLTSTLFRQILGCIERLARHPT